MVVFIPLPKRKTIVRKREIKGKGQLELNFKQPKFNKLDSNFKIISDENALNKLCGFFRKQLKKYSPSIQRREIVSKREAVKRIILKIIDIKQTFDQIKNYEVFMENKQNQRFDPKEVNETRSEINQEHIKLQRFERELLDLMKDNNYNPIIVKEYISKRPSLMLFKDYNKNNF